MLFSDQTNKKNTDGFVMGTVSDTNHKRISFMVHTVMNDGGIIPYKNKKGDVICRYASSEDDPKRAIIYFPLYVNEDLIDHVASYEDLAAQQAGERGRDYIPSMKRGSNSMFDVVDKLKVKLVVDHRTGAIRTPIYVMDCKSNEKKMNITSISEIEKMMKDKRFIPDHAIGPEITARIDLDSYWMNKNNLGVIYHCTKLLFHLNANHE